MAGQPKANPRTKMVGKNGPCFWRINLVVFHGKLVVCHGKMVVNKWLIVDNTGIFMDIPSGAIKHGVLENGPFIYRWIRKMLNDGLVWIRIGLYMVIASGHD